MNEINIRNVLKSLLLASVLLSTAMGTMKGANEPLADNELGLASKDCASFCPTKDSLLLWYGMKDTCAYNDANKEKMVKRSGLSEISSTSSPLSNKQLWSPHMVGSFSALLATIGMITGLQMGQRARSRGGKVGNLCLDLKQFFFGPNLAQV